ncbi:site-specific integrase [Edaphobacter sp. 12200R-103]|uniref:tyrosine-type recombinase/integrase n=1 Tax=Edaphobacter sp. 12200R-103 TaxID=2703788 RepID=UPI00138D9CA9|nr:site-specific integrase [Edaphobacter sp. 12200R-103]QHS51726.1 site-specific integrase [Edaphobacter sp. 12200R-103]
MARLKGNLKLDTRTARRSIPVSAKLHTTKIQTGLALGYRKGLRGGSWIARRHEGGTKYSFEPLGVADDHADADGIAVLSCDQAQVKAREWATRKAADDAGEVVSGKYTVADAMADYLKHLEREKRKPQDRTKSTIDAHILPALGTIQLSKLTHGKVKKWRDALADGSPRTRTGFAKEKVWCVRMVHGKPKGQYRMRVTETKIPLKQAHREIDDDPETLRKRQASANRILTVLKAALNHACVERKVSTKAAWENVKAFRNADAAKIRFLSVSELKAFIPVCETDFRRLVKGALVTGARYGELAAMFVEDFNEPNGTVYVATSKNGESRHIHLNDEGIAFFKQMVKGRNPNDPMFVRANGEPWKTSEQQRPMDAACKDAHIEGVTFHILRHTYASHSVMNGMPLEVLQKQLGHKDIRITIKHYAHLCSDYKQQSVRAHAPSFGFAEPVEIMNGPLLVQRQAKTA